MASTFSSYKIELIGLGDQTGTWGTTTNANLGTAIEQAIGGAVTVDYATDANKTLAYTDSNASQEFRALKLTLTSSVSLTATRDLVIPAINKPYIIYNNTTGGQSIQVKIGASTGVTVTNGRTAYLYAATTDVFPAFNALPSGTTIGSYSITLGGTVVFGGAVTTAAAFTTAGAFALTLTTTGITNVTLPTTGTLLAAPSGTSILKANSGGALANATAGTDYISPTGVETMTNKTLTSPVVTGQSLINTNIGYIKNAFFASTATVTVTIATPGVMTWANHGFSANDTITLSTTGALPTGLAINTVYFVRNPSTNTFELSATSGGASINTSGTQSGTHVARVCTSAVTGAITLDWSKCQNIVQNEPTGTITYTFTNPSGPCHCQLFIDSDGTSTAQTFTWPATVVWLGAQWSGTNNKKAVINFWFDGVNFYGQGTNQA